MSEYEESGKINVEADDSEKTSTVDRTCKDETKMKDRDDAVDSGKSVKSLSSYADSSSHKLKESAVDERRFKATVDPAGKKEVQRGSATINAATMKDNQDARFKHLERSSKAEEDVKSIIGSELNDSESKTRASAKVSETGNTKSLPKEFKINQEPDSKESADDLMSLIIDLDNKAPVVRGSSPSPMSEYEEYEEGSLVILADEQDKIFDVGSTDDSDIESSFSKPAVIRWRKVSDYVPPEEKVTAMDPEKPDRTPEPAVANIPSAVKQDGNGESIENIAAGRVSWLERLRGMWRGGRGRGRRGRGGRVIPGQVRTESESSAKERGYESEKSECEGSPRGRGKVVEDTREGTRRNNAAVKMQAVVRGWLQLRRYQKMKKLAIGLQAQIRAWRARREFGEMKREKAAILIQTRVRGWLQRRRYQKAIRRIIVSQAAVRRYFAKKELKKLKIEAKSVSHQKELNKGLENKIIGLQQRLTEAKEENKALKTKVEKGAGLGEELAKLQKTEEESKSKSNRIKELEEELSSVKAEKEELEEELRSVKAELENERDKIEQERRDMGYVPRSTVSHLVAFVTKTARGFIIGMLFQ